MRQLSRRSHIENEVFSALERIANSISVADGISDDDFDEVLTMAAEDATTCLCDLLPKSSTTNR